MVMMTRMRAHLFLVFAAGELLVGMLSFRRWLAAEPNRADGEIEIDRRVIKPCQVHAARICVTWFGVKLKQEKSTKGIEEEKSTKGIEAEGAGTGEIYKLHWVGGGLGYETEKGVGETIEEASLPCLLVRGHDGTTKRVAFEARKSKRAGRRWASVAAKEVEGSAFKSSLR